MANTTKPTNIYEALTLFRSKIEPFVKSAEAYQYNYVPIDKIIETIEAPMKEAGLGWHQYNTSDATSVTVHTVVVLLADVSQKIESSISAPIYKLAKMNEYQSLGSAITYMRRYDLSTILGLVSDTDTDANGIGQKQVSAPSSGVGLPPVPQQAPAKPSAPATAKAKEVLTEQHPNFQKVVDFVAGGATIDKCRVKYDISEEVAKVITEMASK